MILAHEESWNAWGTLSPSVFVFSTCRPVVSCYSFTYVCIQILLAYFKLFYVYVSIIKMCDILSFKDKGQYTIINIQYQC